MIYSLLNTIYDLYKEIISVYILIACGILKFGYINLSFCKINKKCLKVKLFYCFIPLKNIIKYLRLNL